MKDIVQGRLFELEEIIERGQQTFIDVGRALAEIRDSRLYRQDFSTFEDYCKERWGWSASRARYLIGSVAAVEEMESVTNVTPEETEEKLPPVQNEAQARELAKIKDPVKRAEVWGKANVIATELGTAVTAKLVQEAVEEEESQGRPILALSTNGADSGSTGKLKFNTWLESIMKIARSLSGSVQWLTVIETKHSIGQDAELWTDQEVLYFIDQFDGLQNQAETTAQKCAALSTILRKGGIDV
jgi:hypothetical protein